MDNNLYEVERDEYAGFIGQLNKEKMDVEQCYEQDMIILKIRSKTTGIHLCTRIITDEGEHYYVFNMPADDERIEPKPVRKVTLETKEEVQHFFNALNQVQKGEFKDDRTIS